MIERRDRCDHCRQIVRCVVFPHPSKGEGVLCGNCLRELHDFLFSVPPPPEDAASRPERRSEGAFSGRLREAQAKSAQAAMIGMAEKLQELLDENNRLRYDLNRQSHLLARATARLLELDPPPEEPVILPEKRP